MRGGNTAKAAPVDVSRPEIRGPIDLDFLARQTLGDEGLEQEVLRLFDQMSHAYFERLETSTLSDSAASSIARTSTAAAAPCSKLSSTSSTGVVKSRKWRVNAVRLDSAPLGRTSKAWAIADDTRFGSETDAKVTKYTALSNWVAS